MEGLARFIAPAEKMATFWGVSRSGETKVDPFFIGLSCQVSLCNIQYFPVIIGLRYSHCTV